MQENTRWKALDEIYKIYMLLHRSDLNISENFRQTFSSNYDNELARRRAFDPRLAVDFLDPIPWNDRLLPRGHVIPEFGLADVDQILILN